MAIGEIAKQLAQQALVDTVTPKPAAPAQPESVGAIILGEIQAMQKACKEDEELVVLFKSGNETIRVMELVIPSWRVFVLSGLDEAKRITRVLSAPESLQLVCKVVKVPPPAKPVRVAIRRDAAKS